MTSLFDAAAAEMRLPPTLVAELIGRGGHGVSLLEFLPVDFAEPAAEPVSEERPAVDERARAVAIMIDAAREEATAETARALNAAWERTLDEERLRIERLTVEFARDRQRYFAAAEVQVVRLSLAVARKVLTREVDPAGLALEATVKAAVARVQDGSATVLRVEPAVAAAWSDLFAGEARVTVEADAALGRGECRLETAVGNVELGLEVQLAEIGRGFDQLLGREGGSMGKAVWDR